MGQNSHNPATPWLLFIFRLPTRRASQRVAVWRRLKRYGALPLKTSGYILPNSPLNQEHFEWLATEVRGFHGEASVAQVTQFDDLPSEELIKRFTAARKKDYEALEREIRKLTGAKATTSAPVSRLRRRLADIASIDFFGAPERAQVEMLLQRADSEDKALSLKAKPLSMKNYLRKTWLTRPRPGIDRVSSAWLIKRFIDPKAHFVFDGTPERHPESIPFDMFGTKGFGHVGEECTFETLVRRFAIRDPKVRRIAQAIHDADLEDDKYGRIEAIGLDQVLNGWAVAGISDHDILARGMELFEGLYQIIK